MHEIIELKPIIKDKKDMKNNTSLNYKTSGIHRLYFVLLMLVITGLSISCSDNPSSQETAPGSIEIRVETTGGDDAPYGYTASVQGGGSVTLDANGSVIVNNVEIGQRTVQLSDIASHCETNGPATQSVTVTENEVATVTFQVQCSAIMRDKIVLLRHMGSNVYRLYSMDSDGGNVREISDLDVSLNARPAVSPDGLKIAFSRQNPIGNNFQIWVMNADGTGLENLNNNPAATHGYPRWSPDGSKIAFSSNRDYPAWDIYVMNSDGANVVNVTNEPTVNFISADWSPEGDELIFDSLQFIQGDFPQYYRLHKSNSDGTNSRLFINEGSGIIFSHPRWASNGLISFDRRSMREEGSVFHVWVTDANQSFKTNLFVEASYPTAQSRYSSWAPDAGKIILSANSLRAQNTFKLNPDGSGMQNLTSVTDGVHMWFADWSPYTRSR